MILFHSSKTMRRRAHESVAYRQPPLLSSAKRLADYVKSLSVSELATSMHLSETMASKTHSLMQEWDTSPDHQLPAIDAFLGDMYSGLQAEKFSEEDRVYADSQLYLLSGLYGVLRPLDSIAPYRLEMGYKFPDSPFDNLYAFWGNSIARLLPDDDTVFNLSSVEYTKAVLPHLSNKTIITPKFMTIHPDTRQPTNIVVHAKIARGAYVHWLIKNRISNSSDAISFDQLGYVYNSALSTSNEPVFVCDSFQGLGLSVRETKTT